MIMSSRLRDLTIREYVRIALPYTILCVLGAVGRSIYPDTWRIHITLHAFFDACMIAGILAILIELFSANRLVQHVADFLAGRLVGAGLPKELQQVINNIVSTDLIAYNYLQAYHISNRPDKRVNVEVTVSFEIKNYAQASVDWSPSMASQIFYDPQFLHLEYGLLHQKQMYIYDHIALTERVITEPGSRIKAVKGLKAVAIPPLVHDPNACCSVTCKYRLVLPDEFTDITAFGRTTVGAKIRLDAIPEGFDFVASLDPTVEHSTDGVVWHYSNVFLRRQFINVWWFRKNNSAFVKKELPS
jgi:hypothetical protein